MDSNGLGAYERTKAALVNVVTNALKDMGYDVEEKHDEATGRRWWRGKKKGEELTAAGLRFRYERAPDKRSWPRYLVTG